jgi:hypothetical protein
MMSDMPLKHVEPSMNGVIINSITRLHLVDYFYWWICNLIILYSARYLQYQKLHFLSQIITIFLLSQYFFINVYVVLFLFNYLFNFIYIKM